MHQSSTGRQMRTHAALTLHWSSASTRFLMPPCGWDFGTAVERLQEARKRARALDGQLDGDFKGDLPKSMRLTNLLVQPPREPIGFPASYDGHDSAQTKYWT